MSNEPIILEIQSADEVGIKSRLKAIAAGSVELVDKKNNDGIQSIVAILQASAPVIAALSPLIVELIKRGDLRKIRKGQREIANPSEKQFDAIKQEVS